MPDPPTPSRPPSGRQSTAPLADLLPTGGKLPAPLTSFVGREQESTQIERLLLRPEIRLVTLTGPGGVGKTRLALHVAERVAPEFEGNVLFVPLAPIDDPLLVPAEIGRAIGLDDAGDELFVDRVSTVLAGCPYLLVLDNLERLVEAGPQLVRLLSACPTLTILATSRVLLHLTGEWEFRVNPLDFPMSEAPASQIEGAGAVKLFVDRAHIEPGTLSAEQLNAIRRICERLEGLPLAIELAAAKMRIHSADELLARLEQRLPVLDDGPRDAPHRQQSMRNTIAWSYDLLSAQAQALFRTLSVFQGGFTMAAAEGVFPNMDATLFQPCFEELANSSLIRRTDSNDSTVRYSMLETVREFGLEALQASGEEHSARDRHLSWFIRQINARSEFPLSGTAFAREILFPDDQDNLRSALNLALDRKEADAAVRVAYALIPVWIFNGLCTEGSVTLKRVLSISESLEKEVVAGLNLETGAFAYLTSDFPTAKSCQLTALSLYRECGLDDGVRISLDGLGTVTRWTDIAASLRYFDEAIELGKTQGRKRASALCNRGISQIANGEFLLAERDLNDSLSHLTSRAEDLALKTLALAALGWAAGHQRNIEQSEWFARESLSVNKDSKYKVAWNFAHRVLGEAAMARGDLESAAVLLSDGLEVAHQTGILQVESWNLAQLAAVAKLKGDWQRAARLYGATQTMWEKLGLSEPTTGMMSSWSGRHVPSREDLASDAFRHELETGRTLSHADVYAEAREVSSCPAQRTADVAILSRRELQVLELIANLHSNREIADLLFVSKRTVDSHVGSIFVKLGVTSRRGAVDTARQRGLIAG